MIQCECPHCNYAYQVDNTYAGKAVKCPSCSERMEVPHAPELADPDARKEDALGDAALREYYRQRAREAQGGGGGGGGMNPAVGWVIFFLIFGLGNLILYSTTGWLIIPIRR
jgi:hypothetical protein